METKGIFMWSRSAGIQRSVKLFLDIEKSRAFYNL